MEPNEVINAHLEHLDTQQVLQARDNGRSGMKLARLAKQKERRCERATHICEEGPMYGPGIDIELWTVSLWPCWQLSNKCVFFASYSAICPLSFHASLSYRYTAVHLTGIRALISNHSLVFNGCNYLSMTSLLHSLTKLSLKLSHGKVITQHNKTCDFFTYPYPNLMVVWLVSL